MKSLFTTALWTCDQVLEMFMCPHLQTWLKLRAKIEKKHTKYNSVGPKPIAVVHTIVFNSRQKRSAVESVVDACLFIYLLNCKDECFNYIIYSEGSLLDCSFAKLLLYVYM